MRYFHSFVCSALRACLIHSASFWHFFIRNSVRGILVLVFVIILLSNGGGRWGLEILYFIGLIFRTRSFFVALFLATLTEPLWYDFNEVKKG